MKEKLIELMMQAKMGWTKGEFADYLIANGVTIQDKTDMPKIVKREFMFDSGFGWYLMMQLQWFGYSFFLSQQIPNEPSAYINAIIKNQLKAEESEEENEN